MAISFNYFSCLNSLRAQCQATVFASKSAEHFFLGGNLRFESRRSRFIFDIKNKHHDFERER